MINKLLQQNRMQFFELFTYRTFFLRNVTYLFLHFIDIEDKNYLGISFYI